MEFKKETLKQIRGLILFTAVVIVCLWKFDTVIAVLRFVLNVVYPFLLGGAIAFVLNVPMNFVECHICKTKTKYARGISLMVVLLGVAGILALVLFGLIPQLADTFANLGRSMQAFIPEIIGMIVSALLIFAFAASYSNRMFQLRVQMHRVAQGEYDEVERIEGNDEIGELYTELEQMMQDIRLLMSNVVDEQVQKEKLHTKQKEVEFKMLASQINPHFLYNTLETIRMKAVVNHQPEIVELVKMLAKTMRYNIQVTDRLVTLKEELQMVEYYLKIQEYRFGDRITSELTIDPDVDMKARILPLTLQPFVENAFVHGLEEKACDARLVIHVYKKKDDIFIEIRDNGKGMDYYELGHLRKIMKDEQGDDNHIGVRNVNQRIRLLFGGEYGVEVDSEKNVGTKVVIHIPYQTEIDQNV